MERHNVYIDQKSKNIFFLKIPPYTAILIGNIFDKGNIFRKLKCNCLSISKIRIKHVR